MAKLCKRYQEVRPVDKEDIVVNQFCTKPLIVLRGMKLTEYRVLKPGGWAQAVECDFIAQSDNGSLTEAHALVQWSRKYVSALEAIKDPKAGQRLQALFSAAGFSDIGARMIPLPLCGWSNGKITYFVKCVSGLLSTSCLSRIVII